MPELPEVETIKRGLQKVILGETIFAVDQRRFDLRWPFPKNFGSKLMGARIINVRRRSKYLLFDLDTKDTLIVHLGMSGKLLTVNDSDNTGKKMGYFSYKNSVPKKHDHVIFHLAGTKKLYYNDPRRFGAMDLVLTEEVNLHKSLVNLGPEPLGSFFSGDYLYSILKTKKCSIKSALMDQRVVSGLGNIYVSEALWGAKVSPRRRSNSISKQRTNKLAKSIQDILGEAILAGGSSLKDYKQTSGESGYFQHSFNVYNRADMNCTFEGCNSSIKKIVQSGRATFYCASCQK